MHKFIYLKNVNEKVSELRQNDISSQLLTRRGEVTAIKTTEQENAIIGENIYE